MAEALEILSHATRLWEKAQCLWSTPSSDGGPEALAVAEEIAAGRPDCEDGLVGLSSSPNQLVAAYALFTLELMRSRRLAELPEEVLSSKRMVCFQIGSFRNSMTLGDYARQLRKGARARADVRTTDLSSDG